jgi:predicted secreted protein
LEAGRGTPLPEYVGYFALADKLGVSVTRATCLEDVPMYWREAAAVMMRAEQMAHDERASEGKRKR